MTKSDVKGASEMSVVTIEGAVEVLGEALSGPVLAPGDPGYDAVRRVHNGLIDRHPAIIARCVHTADVVDAVSFGRSEGLEISVRGGGHNVAGRAVSDGGLMIDLSLMKGIHVDPVGSTVRAQAGVTIGELDRATGAFGLATPSGVVSTTGIAGLTLGGGIGWLMGKYGMAVDNLLSAEVVLASGEVVTASEDGDRDLFWALCGGGGNFGVVTSFEYRTHRVASVLGGAVLHPLSAAPQLFSFYREFAADLPDELPRRPSRARTGRIRGEAVRNRGLPRGRRRRPGRKRRAHAAHVRLTGRGHDRADAVLRREHRRRLAVAVGPARLLEVGVLLRAVRSGGRGDGERVRAVAQRAVRDRGRGLPRRGDARSPTATAYPHREPGFNLLLISQWTDPAQSHAGIAWARETFDALAPYMADRSYTNYLPADDYDRVRHAFGPNYERLAELKRRYDPDNLFRLNHNLPPAR